MTKRILLTIIFSLIFCSAMASNNVNDAAKLPNEKHDIFRPALGDGFIGYNNLSVGDTAMKSDKWTITQEGLSRMILVGGPIDLNRWGYILLHVAFTPWREGEDWGTFANLPQANYLRHIYNYSNITYKENFAYADFIYKTLYLQGFGFGPDILTAAARDIYDNKSAQEFINLYGDDWVYSLSMGVSLVFNVQVNFENAHEKYAFDRALFQEGKNMSFYNSIATIKDIVSELHTKVTVEVSAYQYGDVAADSLASIFSEKTKDGYYITRCASDDLDRCEKTAHDATDYQINKFAKGITMDTPLKDLAMVGDPDRTMPYRYLGLSKIDSGILPKEIKTARQQLTNMYFTSIETQLLIEHLLRSSSFMQQYLTASSKQVLTTMQKTLALNYELFDKHNVFDCYLSAKQSACPAIADRVTRDQQPLDTTTLAFFQKAFYYSEDSDKNVNNSSIYFVPVGASEGQYMTYRDLPEAVVGKSVFVFKNEGRDLHLEGVDEMGIYTADMTRSGADPDHYKYDGEFVYNTTGKRVHHVLSEIDNPII